LKALLFGGLVVAIAAAIVFRRRLNDPETPLGGWFARLRPKLKEWTMLVFIATFLLWTVVYLNAPDEDRDNLGEAMQEIWKSISGGAPEGGKQ